MARLPAIVADFEASHGNSARPVCRRTLNGRPESGIGSSNRLVPDRNRALVDTSMREAARVLYNLHPLAGSALCRQKGRDRHSQNFASLFFQTRSPDDQHPSKSPRKDRRRQPDAHHCGLSSGSPPSTAQTGLVVKICRSLPNAEDDFQPFSDVLSKCVGGADLRPVGDSEMGHVKDRFAPHVGH